MEAINDLIKQQGLSPEPTRQTKESPSASSEGSAWGKCEPEDIEVPQEAIDEFITQYKRKEAARINSIRYMQHISKPIAYPTFTAEQYYGIVSEKGLLVDQDNQHIIEGLVLYFAGDLRFESWFDEPQSLKKGILLMGNIGCGKTFLMDLFRINPVNAYLMKSCREVTDDYKELGVDGIRKYSELRQVASKNPMNGSELFGWCFDDLGTEEISSNYGNKVNVMEDVILKAYDRSELRGRVHVTTNLSADEIGEKYGPRVRSRMREMFNMITFPLNAADRRA